MTRYVPVEENPRFRTLHLGSSESSEHERVRIFSSRQLDKNKKGGKASHMSLALTPRKSHDPKRTYAHGSNKASQICNVPTRPRPQAG